MDEIISLSTFPKDDKNYATEFEVPTDWLDQAIPDVFETPMTRQEFLDTYVWDMSWFIYLRAKADGVIRKERQI